MKIGAYLRQIRKEKGFSIRNVVIRSRGLLDKTTVSRIERGERSLSIRALYAFSQIYDIPSDHILAQLIGEPVDSARECFDVNEEERALIDLYRKLPRRRQNMLRELMECILSGGEIGAAGKKPTGFYPHGTSRARHAPTFLDPGDRDYTVKTPPGAHS